MAKTLITKVGRHFSTWAMLYAAAFMVLVFGYEIVYQIAR